MLLLNEVEFASEIPAPVISALCCRKFSSFMGLTLRLLGHASVLFCMLAYFMFLFAVLFCRNEDILVFGLMI